MGHHLKIMLLLSMLLLTGCTSMLEREQINVTVHNDAPEAAGESDALRVESYQELVNALLYLVEHREESGTLRLYNYDTTTANADLTAACLEVTDEVPIGAYSVSYLQFDLATIVSYLEADITITYRDFTLSANEILNVAGTSAIRGQLAKNLESFQQQIVLQLNYFDGDSTEILALLERAYYEVPAAALGMPTVEVAFYPRTGYQRIVQMTLTYPKSGIILTSMQKRLTTVAEELLQGTDDLSATDLLVTLCHLVVEQGGLSDTGATAYDALVQGGATSEGLSLALSLLCQQSGVPCYVVQGTLDGRAHFWNIISTPWGYRHIDLSTFQLSDWPDGITEVSGPFFSDQTAVKEGYLWNRDWVPYCGDQPEDERALLASYTP